MTVSFRASYTNPEFSPSRDAEFQVELSNLFNEKCLLGILYAFHFDAGEHLVYLCGRLIKPLNGQEICEPIDFVRRFRSLYEFYSIILTGSPSNKESPVLPNSDFLPSDQSEESRALEKEARGLRGCIKWKNSKNEPLQRWMLYAKIKKVENSDQQFSRFLKDEKIKDQCTIQGFGFREFFPYSLDELFQAGTHISLGSPKSYTYVCLNKMERTVLVDISEKLKWKNLFFP